MKCKFVVVKSDRHVPLVQLSRVYPDPRDEKRYTCRVTTKDGTRGIALCVSGVHVRRYSLHSDACTLHLADIPPESVTAIDALTTQLLNATFAQRHRLFASQHAPGTMAALRHYFDAPMKFDDRDGKFALLLNDVQMTKHTRDRYVGGHRHDITLILHSLVFGERGFHVTWKLLSLAASAGPDVLRCVADLVDDAENVPDSSDLDQCRQSTLAQASALESGVASLLEVLRACATRDAGRSSTSAGDIVALCDVLASVKTDLVAACVTCR